jgi:hypothetical protein
MLRRDATALEEANRQWKKLTNNIKWRLRVGPGGGSTPSIQSSHLKKQESSEERDRQIAALNEVSRIEPRGDRNDTRTPHEKRVIQSERRATT